MSPLAEIDLNLLVVLDALLAERSVTRAAARVGLSQPAMSSALGRLRRKLGDPLLVRTADGMVPTPRAMALAAPLREALSTLEQALESAVDFDPARARRTFCLAATDYAHVVVVPELLTRLARQAPRASLRVLPVREGGAMSEADRGKAEVLLGMTAAPRGALGAEFSDRWVCAVGATHPLAGGLSAESFLATPQVAVVADGPEPIDQLLAGRGLERHVALRVPQIATAALAVARGGLLWVAPERAVAALRPLGLVALELPLPLPEITVTMAWPKRLHADPAQIWFRTLLRELLGAPPDCGTSSCHL